MMFHTTMILILRAFTDAYRTLKIFLLKIGWSTNPIAYQLFILNNLFLKNFWSIFWQYLKLYILKDIAPLYISYAFGFLTVC